MKPGDFEIHASKKIESLKYSYVHTLKVKRGKKGEGCKSGLQKRFNRGTSTRGADHLR
jgi:hypothetical protein